MISSALSEVHLLYVYSPVFVIKICNLLLISLLNNLVLSLYLRVYDTELSLFWQRLKLFLVNLIAIKNSLWTLLHRIFFNFFSFLFTFSADKIQGSVVLISSEHNIFISSSVLFQDNCLFLFTFYRFRNCYSTFCFKFYHFKSDVIMKTYFWTLTCWHSVVDTFFSYSLYSPELP